MEQKVGPRELGRLAVALEYGPHVLERRVEKVSVTGDTHWNVSVRHQLTLPLHGEQAPRSRDVLVPIGQFAKSRLPDLAVSNASGTSLALLSRTDRADVMSRLVLAKYVRRHFLPGVLEHPSGDGQRLLAFIARGVGAVVVDGEEGAAAAVDDLRSVLGFEVERLYLEFENMQATAPNSSGDDQAALGDLATSIRHVLDDGDLWDDLQQRSKSAELVAMSRERVGWPTEMTVTYSEAMSLELFSRANYGLSSFESLGRAKRHILAASLRVVRVLEYFALTSRTIIRSCANSDRTESFWFVVQPPEGTEAVRLFWVRDAAMRPVDAERDGNASSSAALSTYSGRAAVPVADKRAALDFQVDARNSFAMAALLAAFISVMGAYVYRHSAQLTAGTGEQNSIAGVASLFSAAPALLVGGIAFRDVQFTRRLSRGPRNLAVLVAILGSSMAAAVAFRDLEWLTRLFAFWSSVVGLFAAGVFLHVRFGPRYRQVGGSRWRWLTERLTPLTARSLQRYAALLFFVVWLAFSACAGVAAFRLGHYDLKQKTLLRDVWRALLGRRM